MRWIGLIVIIGIIAGAGVFFRYSRPALPSSSPASMSERATLTTKDGLRIAADYYAVSAATRGVVLLHMMPATRQSWISFAQDLRRAGFVVLAIDLRGHGESQGGPEGYKTFSDVEHQKSRLDVEAAVEFLKSKGITSVSIAGASIGANLALDYLTAHPDARAAVLLSPGLDYRGIRIEGLIERLGSAQRVLAVASDEDEYSAESVRTLFAHAALGEQKKVIRLNNAGHGTEMLERRPGLLLRDVLVQWLGQ